MLPSEVSVRLPYRDQTDAAINLIYPIYKHIGFLIIFCLFVVVITAILTLRTPKVYEATAIILPETKEFGGGEGLKAAFLQQFGIAGLGGTKATPSNVSQAVLKSSELAQSVLSRYHYFFMMGINKNSQERVAKSFAKAVKVKTSLREPTISVSIQSNDPILAADLTNSYVVALDKYNRTSAVTSAQRLRKYVEKRLEAVDRELEQSQEKLRNFQEKNRAISISKQTEATLEVLSRLEAQRVALEVEKAGKQKFFKGPHIEIEGLKAQIDALEKNINRLTYSKESKVPVEREKGRIEFYIPLTRIPALNFGESRLLMNVKAKTAVVNMLTTQLEQAKLEETKDVPTINILDWAKPPRRHIKPNLKLNVILSVVVSVFIGIFLVFFIEFIHRMFQNPETSQKWQEMKKGVNSKNTH